jgi:hypothetical protein
VSNHESDGADQEENEPEMNQTGSGVYINVNLPVQFIPPSLFSLYNVLEREALQLLSSSPSSSPTNTTTEVRWLPVAPPYLNPFSKTFHVVVFVLDSSS